MSAHKKSETTLEEICKLFFIEPNSDTIKRLRKSIEARVYSFRYRDKLRFKRYVTLADAADCTDYKINIEYYDISRKDIHLQKLQYLKGKNLSELSPEDKNVLTEYINRTMRPILLFKNHNYSKLLVTTIPESSTITYSDICDIILSSGGICKYCGCKMALFNDNYIPQSLTIDAVIAICGHKKDNMIACCRLCNSIKGHQSHHDFSAPMTSEPPQESRE